ncbi:MAG: HAD-IC family P-type ATPase [Bacilli bacterium]|nr:HAD-IC family P-type ATPase [Bacilli bacterium]
MNEIDYKKGLTDEEVNFRKEQGLVNIDSSVKTKSIGRILSSNIFTLFNFLNLILGLSIILVHSYKNLTFLGVVFCNTIIGIIQEIQAKKIIDRLSILSESKEKVIRNSKIIEVNKEDIVVDDILYLEQGKQVVSDCIIKSGTCEVNESLITGESDPIYKKKNDKLLSGSFVVSGGVYASVIHVGKDNYASIISNEAKYIKKVNSEILNSFNKIIKFISIMIIPLGILLFLKQLSLNPLENSVVNTVAALVGMIPEGLILLTSTVMAVSVIRLSKYNVLVQELYCIETLARVDTLCLDKTGTITEGNLEVADVIIKKTSLSNVEKILSAMCKASDSLNPTMKAISEKFASDTNFIVEQTVPFSSSRKFSSVTFKDVGTFYLGAYEYLIDDEKIKKEIDKYSEEYRVLILVQDINGKKTTLALILISDVIRSDAKETLSYFKEQGVDVKIISGDSEKTVRSIAKKVGLDNYDKSIDMSTVKTDKELIEAVKTKTIFARVTPIQKKKIIIELKKIGKVVAMTGDGVNDVLALRESDCSVALSSGSDAARKVSQLVLLDSKFSSMPKIVNEGRRTINNIERSSSLFLVKTIYTTMLVIIFLFVNMSYPFIPIQITLTSVVTIGIPSFILALEPNKEKIKGLFLINVIRNSLPTALTIVFNIVAIVILSFVMKLDRTITSSLAVVVTGFTGLMLLYKISLPLNKLRFILFYSMCLFFLIGIVGLRQFFSIYISRHMILILPFLMIYAYILFDIFTRIFDYIVRKKIPKKRIN